MGTILFGNLDYVGPTCPTLAVEDLHKVGEILQTMLVGS